MSLTACPAIEPKAGFANVAAASKGDDVEQGGSGESEASDEDTTLNGCEDTPWGDVPEGFSGTAYAANHPAAGEGDCDGISELRTCEDGILSGSYTESECSNYACALQDPTGEARAQVGAWYSRVAASTVVSDWRRCGPDGEWSPAAGLPDTVPSAQFCPFAEGWLPWDTCGFFEGQAFRCEGGIWAEDTEVCPQQP